MDHTALHAFINEYGNTSIETGTEGVSDFFVVTAVLVSAANLERARSGAEAIRQRFFQTGEMKSSRIGQKRQERRLRLLRELVKLPIRTAQVAVDKRALYKDSGLAHKRSFFKNINRRLYLVLNRNFPNLCILADEHGSHDFMTSFKDYIERELPLELFQKRTVDFLNSKSEVLLQVADVFAGSLAHYLVGRYAKEVGREVLEHLDAKSLWLTTWPPVSRPAVSPEPGSTPLDDLVRDYCLRQAQGYLARHAEGDRADHIAALEYLYYNAEFMDDSFVATARIRDRLARSSSDPPTDQTIRELIRNLRDDGVIIASGSTGYKIPTAVSDLHSFVAHANLIVPPMLKRLARARQDMKLASRGELDILDPVEFSEVRSLVDALEEILLARTAVRSAADAD